ncbi:SigE family RNA polymerase sigma factor [Virgisporangium ochraceum]|uniref:RNA polymerase sigma24 factor n=1 Tax=Virgisporangium ochraceum TaxID=65505 RepID=A0A8J3ZNJ6_9ACTN|nr:SigE family RNA polymerase sigma factor [Virgisporangium ochraceum]GIJ67277.1 RNA polymerase sigma24 factor [Virgisporangium ochraceum]
MNEEAYREYVVARMDRLRRMAYLLCHDWHTADDLVSNALLKLYRNWSRAQRADNLDAYVRRILLRSWLDERRRPWRRESSTDEVPDHPAPLPAPVDDRRLLELLRQLPQRRRAVLVLRFYCDLSVEETAATLGVSVGTVKSTTARALDTLRVSIATLGVEA